MCREPVTSLNLATLCRCLEYKLHRPTLGCVTLVIERSPALACLWVLLFVRHVCHQHLGAGTAVSIRGPAQPGQQHLAQHLLGHGPVRSRRPHCRHGSTIDLTARPHCLASTMPLPCHCTATLPHCLASTMPLSCACPAPLPYHCVENAMIWGQGTFHVVGLVAV